MFPKGLRDLNSHPIPSDKEIKKRGFCAICKLCRLISTATDGIVRVQCAESVDILGNRHGRLCTEFTRFSGMQDGDLYCGRFIKSRVVGKVYVNDPG